MVPFWKSKRPATSNPVVAEMLSWVDQFAAGAVDDPALHDGTLHPGERVAVRIGPVTRVTFAIASTPTVATSGGSGTLLATDRRVLLLGEGAAPQEWTWSDDVESVTALRDGLGVMFNPSAARYAAGVHTNEGLVVPALVEGGRLGPDEVRSSFPAFVKVQAAWRASQAGGLEEWRPEFQERYGR